MPFRLKHTRNAQDTSTNSQKIFVRAFHVDWLLVVLIVIHVPQWLYLVLVIQLLRVPVRCPHTYADEQGPLLAVLSSTRVPTNTHFPPVSFA